MPKKPPLGQHFLTRPEIAGWVADAVPLGTNDTVLEIGPGKGVLTEVLLERAGRVIALERDRTLAVLLHERFHTEIADGRLHLIETDVRDFDPSTHPLLSNGYVLIANIPYYITGAILRQFLTSRNQPRAMALLVQKEVAQRITAANGKESLLSLSVKAYGVPEYVRTVKAGSFSPPPKVDSAILAVHDISRTSFETPHVEELFFTLIHAGFSSKRKQIGSLLDPYVTREQISAANISPRMRAEDVHIDEWLQLAALLL